MCGAGFTAITARGARLSLLQLLLLLLLWARLRGDVCDNGELYADKDLLPPEQYLCHETTRLELSQMLPSIQISSTVQRHGISVCMNESIAYIEAVPNSGTHRPLGAVSGDYLYCPPQRWLNNLQRGALVLLYHPCVSEMQQARLSTLSTSCLSHYVLTAHPQLSRQRPLALVTWGSTLEMSHLPVSELCDWLGLNALGAVSKEEPQRATYRLLLRQAAVRPLPPTVNTRLALKRCCVETLSLLLEEQQRKPALRRRKAFLPVTAESLPNSHTYTRSGREGKSHAHENKLKSVLRRAGAEPPRDSKGAKPEKLNQVKEQTNCSSTERCVCVEARAQVAVATGNQRVPTPRTDEAVWAAAALGFLLALLAVSILHTRMYRHCRTSPSHYWHDPLRDQDSVADVIRRRLKMMGRRKRRAPWSRKQECLLPSSSEQEEESE